MLDVYCSKKPEMSVMSDADFNSKEKTCYITAVCACVCLCVTTVF